MGEVRVTGGANLVAVPFGGDFVGAADKPGIFRRAILAELGKEFLEAGVELALGAVAMEVQRNVASRRHILVYARRGRVANGSGLRLRTGEIIKKGVPTGRPSQNFDLFMCSRTAYDVCCGCSARLCLISFTFSTRSSACLIRLARSSWLAAMSALRRYNKLR